jgi:hypothetical protein
VLGTASFAVLLLLLDQPEGAIELKVIRLTIGACSALDLKFVVIELHFAARAALLLER